MKRYSTHHWSPELESHHQMQFRVILRTLLFSGWGSYPSAIYSHPSAIYSWPHQQGHVKFDWFIFQILLKLQAYLSLLVVSFIIIFIQLIGGEQIISLISGGLPLPLCLKMLSGCVCKLSHLGFMRLCSKVFVLPSLLLGAWSNPFGKYWRGQELLHPPCIGLDWCVGPTIKWLCAIFWHGEMSDKSQSHFSGPGESVTSIGSYGNKLLASHLAFVLSGWNQWFTLHLAIRPSESITSIDQQGMNLNLVTYPTWWEVQINTSLLWVSCFRLQSNTKCYPQGHTLGGWYWVFYLTRLVQRSHLPRQYLLCLAEFIAWHLRHPNRSMPQNEAFFVMAVHESQFVHGTLHSNDLVSNPTCLKVG